MNEYEERMLKKFYGDLADTKEYNELIADIRNRLREHYSIKGEFKPYV